MVNKVITLYNSEKDVTVEVIVSEEDAIRAETDLQFATTLMNAALQERAAATEELEALEQGNTDMTSDSVNIFENETHNHSSQQEDTLNSEDNGLYRWTTEMILLLLYEYYVSREEKFSSGKYSQKKIWEQIAEAIKPKIPSISGPQCASKMRSLQKSYKSVKDHNNKSRNDRRTWQFYEKMDTIFQAKAWASPVAVAPSSGVSTQKNDKSESELSSKSSSTLTKRESVVSFLKRRLRQKTEEEEARAKRHKERVEIDEKMLALLSKLVDKK